MSKYTTELRYIVETGFDLGLKDYPIFDENYRTTLNQKIIEHYYFREIGFETAELFKFFLNRTMREIMPYYNKLYNSELLKIEPLATLNYSEKYERTELNKIDSTGTADGTNTTLGTISKNNDDKNIFSETPQGMLTIDSIETNTYATTADITKNIETQNTDATETNTLTNSKNETGNTTENYIRSFLGNNGSHTESKLLIEFRKTFLNIDLNIIDELSMLFMNLW